jgi:hypothetical protein
MTNNVGFTFSVGDITPRLTISIEQDMKLVTLNDIFTVVLNRFEANGCSCWYCYFTDRLTSQNSWAFVSFPTTGSNTHNNGSLVSHDGALSKNSAGRNIQGVCRSKIKSASVEIIQQLERSRINFPKHDPKASTGLFITREQEQISHQAIPEECPHVH